MVIKEISDAEKKIVEAAKSVFVRKGYEAASMGDIASEAGISRTALNYYYRTKENLFEAIFGDIIRTFVPRLEAIANNRVPFLQKIEPIATQYISLIQENPLLPVFILGEINRDIEHLLGVVAGMKDKDDVVFRLTKQIEQEMDEGTLRRIPMIDVVSVFFGMVGFPMVVKNMLTCVFLNGDKEQFDCYYRARKSLAVEVMTQLLSPR